ncbi:MAG TPA: ABC transporter permease [Usitatibacter sp.]|nr:ABC transporter permease [Usitatibacter sp.]
MASPRWLKVARDASLHKGRTLFAVLALATGLTGTGALLDTWSLVRRATAETYLASLPVSATLRVDHSDGATLDEIRALPRVAAAHGRRVATAALVAETGETPLLLLAPDTFDATDMARLALASGRWPRDGEVAIEGSSLELSRASVGERVRVRAGLRETESLEVVGVAHDVSVAPGWMDHVVYGFVSAGTLERLGAGTQEIRFRVRDAAPTRDGVRAVADELRGVVERHGARVLAVNVPVPNQHVHAAQMDSLLLTQGGFALLALAACALLVVNLMAALLAGQSREIAVMKTLGASPRQLLAMYLAFAGALGLAASVIALPLAAAIARPYASLKGQMLNFPVDGFAIPAWAFALQAIAGVLVPVLATAFTVRRACRASVVQSLRDGASGGERVVTSRLAIPGLGRPLMLSLNNAFRRRGRLALTLATLAAGGAVFVAAHNLRASVLESVDAMFAGFRQDFLLRVAEPQPAARLESIVRATEGIALAEAWTGASANAPRDGAPGDNFALLGLPVPSALMSPRLLAGRWLATGDGRALVASRALAVNDPRFVPGGEVMLAINGIEASWKVVGLIEGLGQPMAYAPREAVGRARGDAGAMLVNASVSPASRPDSLGVVLRTRAALEAEGVRVATSSLAAELRRSLEDHLLLVVQFLGALGWVMLAVGGMGLASTLGLAVLERTREIGVMRAIGAPHRAIVGMLQAESLVIGLIAWAIALAASVPASIALGQAFGAVMFPIPMHLTPDLAGSLQWLGAVVVISVGACAGPSLRALRIPAARALAA